MEIIVLLALLFLIAIAIGITTSIIHLALFLLVAGFIGWIASRIVLGDRPYGCLGSTLAGLVGGWLGHLLIGPIGPALFGVRLLPALVGAIILTLVVSLLFGRSRR
ncbi:MAG: GlsB/YeaQ/YmgE family stress response membrane protein [Chloroflexota bacterium]|jgi:uncharacterized membrane protein YeaQ/YmgE (transglycosylase-associated protein family)